jgi:energy-coupling factor transporter ATP-binding protein EcfA2
LLKPVQGRVEVLGHDTRHTPISELARQVGFVFQNPDHQLFADSVWEEATFAARNFGMLAGATEARVGQLLARCGLSDRREDHPYRLSYGQKRRLNLISVLSYGPKLILLDEILIGQDPANAAFLLDLLQEHAAAGGAVLVVNHAPEITRRYASRLLFFDSGQIIVDAPTKQAFDRLHALGREVYAA